MLAAACFAWLALTKVFFRVVLTVLLVFSLVVWPFIRSPSVRVSAAMLAAAFSLCTPRLFYTWSLTGRSTEHCRAADSFTGCHPPRRGVRRLVRSLASTEGNNPTLRAHHQATYESIADLPAHEAGPGMTRKAIENIRHHPGKYAETGRPMWADAVQLSFSYTEQKLSSFYYILPNSISVTFGGLALFLLVYRWRSVTARPRFLLALFTISLAGSFLVSAYGRMFAVISPLLYVLTLHALSVLVEIRWKGAPAGSASPERWQA